MNSASRVWLCVLATLSAFSLANFSIAQEVATAPAEYGVRPDQAAVGSNIRGYALRSTLVPVNRTWSQLTGAEKEKVRDWYKSLDAADEPPFPTEGLKPLFDYIKQGQSKIRARGQLVLIADVDANGKVTRVRSASDTDRDMINFASQLLAITSFKPARCKGAPCAMEFPLIVEFVTSF